MRKIDRDEAAENFFGVAYEAGDILRETIKQIDILETEHEDYLEELRDDYLDTVHPDEEIGPMPLDEARENYGQLLTQIETAEDLLLDYNNDEIQDELDNVFRALDNLRYVAEYRTQTEE